MNSLKSIFIYLFNKATIVPIICWLFFILYELTVVYFTMGKLERPYIYLVYYAVNIGFFYAQVKLLNKTFTSTSLNYLAGFLLYVAIFIVYLSAKFLADLVFGHQDFKISNPYIYVQNFFLRNIARSLYFTIIAVFYWSAVHVSYFRKGKISAERQQLKVEKEKAQLAVQLERSRNAYLQQQINPHMLFNALNFVFNTVQKHSDDAAHCIWLLSEIIRFSLEETGPDGKIVLEKETEQIENLVAINRYRFKDPLHFTLTTSGDFSTMRIIPLILLTLTENIFKHGDLTDARQPALLAMKSETTGKFTFFSSNLKKSKNEHARRQQLGLQNIRIRLNSEYPDNYQLIIAEAGDLYELTLSLNLCT
ncbi:two-component system LytT family sensor kinase [Mucilaginibacter sp. UYP25]|uniref:sensor histidine kinase n=1 Tax=unclassified Mucilaginibacter TaxID=2617802 RepID=UPI0033929E62